MAEQYCTRVPDFCYQFSHCSPQKKFLLGFLCFKLCIFSRGDSSKSVTYPRVNEGLYATNQRQEDVELQKRGELGEAEGKRDDTIFSPLPLPFFPYFTLATTHGLLFLPSPIFICQKKIKDGR